MKSHRWLFIVLALLTALRIWTTGSAEMAPEESYHYLWSQHPDICYFGNGPGVAAAIRIGTDLLGATERGVRFLSPLLTLGTSLIVYLMACRLFSEQVAVWAALALNFLPILQLGSVATSTDNLSIFFWTATLFSFWLALEKSSLREEESLGSGWSLWWPVTGILIGLGFLCAWTNAMQLASIFIVLISGNRFRRHFKQPGFWAMLLMFFVFTFPPLLWNAQHGWITFTHLSKEWGFNEPLHLNFGQPFAFLAAHAGMSFYSPLLFAAMLVAVWRELPRAKDHFKPRFLLSFTVPVFLVHLIFTLKKTAQVNWTAPAMISAVIISASYWHERALHSTGVRRFMGFAFGTALALSILVLNTDLLRGIGIPYAYTQDKSVQHRSWITAAEAVEKLRLDQEKALGSPLFLIANDGSVASSIGFYLKDKRMEGPGHPPVYTPESQSIEDQFSFWPRYDEFVALKPGQRPADPLFTEESGFNPFHGRNALFITDSDADIPPSSISGGFEKSELIACFDIQRRGRKIRQIRVFECTNYHSRSL